MRRYGSFGVHVHARAGLGRVRYRIAAAGAAIAAVLAAAVVGGLPAASASQEETVIVSSTGLLSPAAAVLQVGGTVLTQYHIIDGVDALIPALLEPVLAALPGITVTQDVAVTVQSTPESTSPHAPSDAFLQETGATRLSAQGDVGQGVTVAVLDTGIDNLPTSPGGWSAGWTWPAGITHIRTVMAMALS